LQSGISYTGSDRRDSDKAGTHAQKITGIKNVCMAGGVALNCAANGKLLSTVGGIESFYTTSCGRCRRALGAALAGQYIYFDEKRMVLPSDSMKGAFWTPIFKRRN
jgi:carbamoyltransferase